MSNCSLPQRELARTARPRSPAIARALKRLAADEHVAVVAASQLNRASESRAERRPTLADLRESGELENAADAVVLLHRESDLPENLLMIVAKNRHGRVGETSVMAMYSRASLVSLTAPTAGRPWS